MNDTKWQINKISSLINLKKNVLSKRKKKEKRGGEKRKALKVGTYMVKT